VLHFSSESFQDKLFVNKVNKLRFGQVNLLKQVTKREWVNAVALPFNSKAILQGTHLSIKREKHFILHPIPGSLGGTDLWKK
jgi:hypothetical protein